MAQQESQAAAIEPALAGFDRLPYPVALTARRMAETLRYGGDPLKALFALKDCFEATIKYLGVALLIEYFSSPSCTPEHSERLIERLVRPSLGDWVNTVVRDLSEWLISAPGDLGRHVACSFVKMGRGVRPQATDLWKRCDEFVTYRNDALGHGAMRRDAAYRDDIEHWLPLMRQLLEAVASLQSWRLLLVQDCDRCQTWMGTEPATATEPGEFRREQIGHFVLRGRFPQKGPEDEPEVRELYPFICYAPDARKQKRLHYYDSIYRYQETRKDVRILEYDEGYKQVTRDPVAGLEARFTEELLSRAVGRHRTRMEVIEGRVAGFGELLVAHTDIVGRRFAIDRVKRFIEEHDRGLLLIEAEPGRGKTALLCHLIDNEFAHYSPAPVHFFYRRTAGITDPDICIKSLYVSLLEAHGIEESEESRRQDSPEAVFHKLVNLLNDTIAPRLAPSRPQLVFIDALDEAESTASGRTAYQRIPENLPAGVYIIATARPVQDRIMLARRAHLEFFDLDSPDLLQENLRDGAEYVKRELVTSQLPAETLDEIARIGRGNFLVLKHVCAAVRDHLKSEEVRGFLARLATASGADQLGFVYEEFWDRITRRATLDEQRCLGDVAGLLVAARAAVPAELICGVLDLRAGAWDLALRRLIEYVTVLHYEEDGPSETLYRIYHESFADFLRLKLATDRDRCDRLLAEYCLRWAELPASVARLYVLRFGPAHLMATGNWAAVEALLTDLGFLEAKTAAGMVFELAGDFAAAVRLLPEGRPQRHALKLLNEALRRDIHFIARHAQDYPQGLFQCFWNTCWWYDCDEVVRHYSEPVGGWKPENAPWMRPAEQKLCRLMERWHEQEVETRATVPWVRANRPPPIRLGAGQDAVLSLHVGEVNSVAYSPDGRRIASGSSDSDVRVWDALTGTELAVLGGHKGYVNSVRYSPDGRRIASGSDDGTVRIWDSDRGTELAVWSERGEVKSLEFSPDGTQLLIVTADPDGLHNRVKLRNAENNARVAVMRKAESVSCVAFSPHGSRIAGGDEYGKLRIWDTSGAVIHIERDVVQGGITSLAYSADGRLAIGSSKGEVVEHGGRIRTTVHGVTRQPECVSCLAYSPDGRWIVCGSWDGAITAYFCENDRYWELLCGHAGPVNCVALGAVASFDGITRLLHRQSHHVPV
jgi:hypothetical protein